MPLRLLCFGTPRASESSSFFVSANNHEFFFNSVQQTMALTALLLLAVTLTHVHSPPVEIKRAQALADAWAVTGDCRSAAYAGGRCGVIAAIALSNKENSTIIVQSTVQPAQRETAGQYRFDPQPDTLFEIASNTKVMTAILAFALCEEHVADSLMDASSSHSSSSGVEDGDGAASANTARSNVHRAAHAGVLTMDATIRDIAGSEITDKFLFQASLLLYKYMNLYYLPSYMTQLQSRLTTRVTIMHARPRMC